MVCDSTDLAKLIHEHIAKENAFKEVENPDGQQELTFRIDTKLLAEAESTVDGETEREASERLPLTRGRAAQDGVEGRGRTSRQACPLRRLRGDADCEQAHPGGEPYSRPSGLHLPSVLSAGGGEELEGTQLRRVVGTGIALPRVEG
ncbi:MAG: hypothetical protein N3C12_14970 [Candidatus Binatia bacterium]|nr:hypothetical protein [Candidatus Binatia bacterium]